MSVLTCKVKRQHQVAGNVFEKPVKGVNSSSRSGCATRAVMKYPREEIDWARAADESERM